jgi:predicted nucleic acid-binding protein
VIRAASAGELVEHTSAGSVVAAPSLYGSEVANALWKYVNQGSLELETALERYEEAIALIDDFTAARELATEALSEAVRYRHPVYDLIYAVLARRTGCVLLTMDSRLVAWLSQIGIRAVQA